MRPFREIKGKQKSVQTIATAYELLDVFNNFFKIWKAQLYVLTNSNETY